MKLTDIPPHVTKLNPPWFSQKAHNVSFQEEIVPLFHSEYHDGPLAGYFKYNDKYFYTKAIYNEDRKYWASWELTAEEVKTALGRHELFCKYVGEHLNYYLNEEGDWARDLDKVKPEQTWDLFYKNKELPTVDIKAIEERDIFGVLLNPFRSW